MFHRTSHEDPSLIAARERVQAAEHAEREADRALAAARISVREARDHVKALEREASEEARLAKIKQQGAKDLNRRAKPLGRELYFSLYTSSYQVMVASEMHANFYLLAGHGRY